MGRLVASTGPWGSAAYKYDALGNLREKTEGADIAKIAYSTLNRVFSVTDANGAARQFTHDARGNVLGNGNFGFKYDFADQPVLAAAGVNGNAAYAYDGNLKRVKTVETPASGPAKTVYTVYGLSGALLHRDDAGAAETTDYVSAGPEAVARIVKKAGAFTPTFVHADHLGSPIAATGAGGAIQWRERHAPFGKATQTFGVTGANDNQPGFTGHVADAFSDLVYMQARFYDPAIGRFYSIDPVGFTGDPASFNRYAYVHNDPVNKTDPTGEFAIPLVYVAVVALAAVFFTADDVVEAATGQSDGTIIGDTVLHGTTYQSGIQDQGRNGSSGGPGAGKRFGKETPAQKAAKEGVPCTYCGTETTNEQGKPNSRERDHAFPKSRGGNNTKENEKDSCRSCNREKGAKTPSEYEGAKEKEPPPQPPEERR
jgi:RHS repeat-associated protein